MEMHKYLSFLSDLDQCLNSLAALEQKKITAIQAGDFEALDECMKKEQAAALDLRGREQKRAALLAQLGLPDVPLRQLPDHCPAEARGQISEVTQRVLRSYEVLSSAQTAARTLMESNLRRIGQELDRREAERRQKPAAHPPQTDVRV